MSDSDGAAGERGVFLHPVRIGWGHCDPAGIVYFPRFFELFHDAMERWFSDALGMPYAEVILGRNVGFPSVHTEADFKAPSVFGDELVIELRVGGLGHKSIVFDYRVRVADDPDAAPRVVGRTVCAVMDLDEKSERFRRSLQLPADLREAIEGFMRT
ncbi:MAG: acyl-CoA thioesterase [Myxococcota bacterium]